MILIKNLLLLIALSTSLTGTSHAKYQIFSDPIAVGDVLKPEAGSAFAVQSTTELSLPCPKMTEVQRDAVVTTPTGGCIYNTTSLSTEFWSGSTWSKAGSLAVISEWATGITYGVGAFVYTTPDFKLYLANTPHTSGATFPGDIANWDEASDDLDRLSSATDNVIPRFDGTSGDLIQESGLTIDDSDNLTGIANLTATGTTTIATSITGPIRADSGVLSTADIDLASEVTGILPAANIDVAISSMPSTGLHDGGVLSIGAPTTTFSISDGFGYIVDATTDPAVPTVTYVSWTGKTNISATGLAANFTEIAIDVAGTVFQSAGVAFTNAERRGKIVIGRLVHTGHTVVQDIGTIAQIGYNVGLTLSDMSLAVGAVNVQGNTISYNGANLNLDISAGKFFAIGENYDVDPADPNVISHISGTAITWFYNYRDGSGGSTVVPSQTAIVPGKYDAGTGILNNVSSNKWSTQRVFRIPASGTIVIQYGQDVYNTEEGAANGIFTEAFVTDPEIAASGILIGYIIVRGGGTDLSDMGDARFEKGGKFGEGTAGGSASTVSTMQSVYENSIAPQTILNTTQGGIEIEDAATPTAADLFTVQSTGAAQKFFNVDVDSVDTSVDILMSGTGQIDVPTGTTAQRSGSPNSGMIRYNSTLGIFEGYATSWGQLGGAPSFDTVTKTTTATLAIVGENNVVVDASGGDFTVTLPAASGNSGLTYSITSESTGVTTIEGNGSETIGGELNVRLASKDDSIIITTDGVAWFYLSDDVVYAAKYTSNNGTQAITSSKAILKYEDLGRDTHGGYNISTGIYTAPIGGTFEVNACYFSTSVAFAAGGFVQILIDDDIGNTARGFFSIAAAITDSFAVCVGDTLVLAKDDEVSIHGQASSSTFMGTSPQYNIFTVKRIK